MQQLGDTIDDFWSDGRARVYYARDVSTSDVGSGMEIVSGGSLDRLHDRIASIDAFQDPYYFGPERLSARYDQGEETLIT